MWFCSEAAAGICKSSGKPDAVKNFIYCVQKRQTQCLYKWSPFDNAFAYNKYYGTHPDKLYTCIMVHFNNEYWMKAMDSKRTYYYTIESINENGISDRTPVIKID